MGVMRLVQDGTMSLDSDVNTFLKYHPKDPLPSVVQILNGEKPSNTGKVLMERPPFTAYKQLGFSMRSRCAPS